MSNAIEGKIVLVTGSAAGIGKGIATEFARRGAKLFICDLNPDTLAKTKEELEALGVEVGAIQYDARNVEDCEKVFNALITKYGDIDILINNTGIAGPTAHITEMTLEDWNANMEVNLRSTFYFCKMAAPYMMKKKFGKIVNISSMTGKRSLWGRTPYCASKIGIIGLTRCLAEELGVDNINVNAICPGAVGGDRMEMLIARNIKLTGKTREELLEGTMANVFLKRVTSPDHIAQLAVFLSDDNMSSDITAQDININMGQISH